MKTAYRSAIAGIGALALFVAAVFAGRAMRPESSEMMAPAEVDHADGGRSRSHSSAPTSVLHGLPFQSAHDDIDAALGEPNLFERSLSLAHFTSIATAEECRSLLKECALEDEMAIRRIAARWAMLEPRGLLEFLQGEGKRFQNKPWAVEEMAAAWVRSKPDAALAASDGLPTNLQTQFRRHLIGNLLYLDPEKAMAFIVRSGSMRDRVLPEYSSWSDANPVHAGELILNLPRSNFKNKSSATLAQRWGETDPEAAMRFADQLEPVFRDIAVERILYGWMARDINGAKRYASEELRGGSLARVGVRIAERMAEEDPATAKEWVDSNLSGGTRANSLVSIIKRGAMYHPQAAAEIADNMPTGYHKKRAITSLAVLWPEHDPAGAGEWLATLDSGFVREAAIEGLKKAQISEGQRQSLIAAVGGAQGE